MVGKNASELILPSHIKSHKSFPALCTRPYGPNMRYSTNWTIHFASKVRNESNMVS